MRNELLPEAQPAHLTETCLNSQSVYQGHFLHVRRDEVCMPDGAKATREYIVHPGAVMVIPILDDGRLVMERQYRYPIGRAVIEFPAGKLEAGEPVFECARRELFEETGYTAREWARAGLLHPTISYSDEFIEIWFARGLRPGERQLDAGEFLDVMAVTQQELLAACCNGTVTDGKTLAGMLWLQNHLSGAWPLEWQVTVDPGKY